MNPETRRLRLERFEALCRREGVLATAQRKAILKTVLDLDDHPTADQIHAALSHKMADVSRATVYRGLETLARMGLITKACHPGSAVRYDRNIELHHHLICMRCDAVLDLDNVGLDEIRMPDTTNTGFELIDFRVQLRGICKECKQKEEQP